MQVLYLNFILLIQNTSLWQDCYFPHFRDKQTEAPPPTSPPAKRSNLPTSLHYYMTNSARNHTQASFSSSPVCSSTLPRLCLHFLLHLPTFKQASVFMDCCLPRARHRSALPQRSLQGSPHPQRQALVYLMSPSLSVNTMKTPRLTVVK